MNETKTNLTLKQRRRLQGSAQPVANSQGDGGRKELPLIAVILILLLAFGGGTALGMIYFRPDPRLQDIEDMQAIRDDENAPDSIRRDFGRELGELAESLPADLRSKAGTGWGGGNRMASFFAKSSADQLADLENRIAREKEWEAERAEREAEQAAKPADSADANNSNNNSNRGGHGGKNDQQRMQSMEQHLANRPPEQRAQGSLYHQMMNSVRQQNGLSVR